MFFFYQTRVSEIKKKCFHIPKSNKALLTNAFFFIKKTGKTTISQKKLNLGNISTKNFS